ncbi:MAG TPA: carbohydrate ABC transporter substrate-binding protein, partial [Acholeplasma sp.]|nr:carbohydrate ABC transporter substrate-binding protein [Acholeplasma sp.]
GGEVLVIRAWNTEFQDRSRAYYPEFKESRTDGTDLLKDGTVVKWIITPNENNAYQNALDQDLLNQSTAAQDDRIDIFLIEADYALKYVNSEYSLDIKADLGITDAQLSNQYKYTQEIVTSSDGKLKGTSWQATPGLFAYRADIAREVLGTDDPVEVQKAIANWDKFDETAEDMKAAGYNMLAGYDDAYRVFSNNMSKPWVNANNEIEVDQNITRWIEQTKEYTTKGYNKGASLWDSVWQSEQGPSGKTFGFFYSTWGINFTLLGNSLANPDQPAEVGNGLFGDWRVAKGPQSWYWGGTWIVGAKYSDNRTLVKDVMLKLTTDKAIMKKITVDTQDYTNHKAAMLELANDPEFGSAFLGGQNHIKLFVESANAISLDAISPYDQGITETLQAAMKDYFVGTVTLDKAWENFYTNLKVKHPELKEKTS